MKTEKEKREEEEEDLRPFRIHEGGACHALQPDLLHQQCHLYPGGMDTPQQGAEG